MPDRRTSPGDHPEKVCGFTAEFAEKNPKTVRAVLRALHHASMFIDERPMIDFWKVRKVYATEVGSTVAVEDFTLRIAEGEFMCVIGHSGCGKSTVLSILMGLAEATQRSARRATSRLPGALRVALPAPIPAPMALQEQNGDHGLPRSRPRRGDGEGGE